MENTTMSSDPPQTSRQNRNKKRFENKRSKESEKTDSQNKQDLYKKLYYGFRNLSDAMQSMQINTVSRSIILPISTRSAGFIIRFMITKFSRLGIQNINYHNLGCALYRVTLFQINLKIALALHNQCSRNIGHAEFMTLNIPSEMKNAICGMGANFAPLVNLISSIGVVRAFGTVYIPRIPTLTSTLDCDPTLVYFHNLRHIVIALANPVTDVNVRRYFYDHCPIPNAIWNTQRLGRARDGDGQVVDPNPDAFPVLLNPDDIMPTIYDFQNMVNDITIISDAIEKIGRKYEKFISVGGVDYNTLGNFTQLVSNHVESVRCIPVTDQRNYNDDFSGISGSINEYWSSEMIGESEFYLGSLHLLGEIPIRGIQFPVHEVRSLRNAKQEGNVDYISSIQNLLG